jgi:hypothetical protein
MPKLRLNGARVVILTLIAGFFALMFAGPGTMILLAAAPSSAKVLGAVVCRTGTSINARWVRYSYSRPGQSNLEITCDTEDGRPSSENTWWFAKLFGLYFVLLLLPVFYLSLVSEATITPKR